MSVFLIVGPKSTLAASNAAPGVSDGEYADGTTGQTGGRTDGRTPDHYIMLSATYATSVINDPHVPRTNHEIVDEIQHCLKSRCMSKTLFAVRLTNANVVVLLLV